MFDLIVLTPKQTLFDDAVESVWIDGDQTEYELLSFHAHLLGILRGRIIIDKKKVIPIKRGIVSFYENKCTVLAEQ